MATILVIHLHFCFFEDYTDISQTCKSLVGFQSCSTNMTVSAPVRLRPRPPTWVVNSNMSMDGSLLNLEEILKWNHMYINPNNKPGTCWKMVTLRYSFIDMNMLEPTAKCNFLHSIDKVEILHYKSEALNLSRITNSKSWLGHLFYILNLLLGNIVTWD